MPNRTKKPALIQPSSASRQPPLAQPEVWRTRPTEPETRSASSQPAAPEVQRLPHPAPRPQPEVLRVQQGQRSQPEILRAQPEGSRAQPAPQHPQTEVPRTQPVAPRAQQPEAGRAQPVPQQQQPRPQPKGPQGGQPTKGQQPKAQAKGQPQQKGQQKSKGKGKQPEPAPGEVRTAQQMKTSLEHLPAQKQQQLEQLVKLYRDGAPTEMIILFGSYARGDFTEDPKRGYYSDYDLLIVVETPAVKADDKLWDDLESKARKLTGPIPVNTVVHDIKDINQEIRAGHYFFADVVKDGIVLHDSRRLVLAKVRALHPGERLRNALYDFRYWYESARGFWYGASFFAARGQTAHAAYLLHEAAERFLDAVMMVFSAYKPKTHDLRFLAVKSAPFHPELADALPRITPEDSRLFKLLNRAYVEARYSSDFRLTPEDLTQLRERVRDLARRVRVACADKLKDLGGPQDIAELPAVPTDEDLFKLPEPPANTDATSLQAWRSELVTKSRELGEALGRREGLREGREEGRREGEALARARAVVAILHRREVTLEDAERDRLLTCRDETELTRLENVAWTANSAAELWPQPPQ